MSLNHDQKRYIKKNLRNSSLEDIAKHLQVRESEILAYLKDHWRDDKYKNFIKEAKKSESLQIIYPFPFKDWLKKHWPYLTFLAILVFGVYANSLFNEFVSDDKPAILQNPKLGSLQTIADEPLLFFRHFLYFLAYYIGGMNPVVYRLINIAFHLGYVWLIYLLLTMISLESAALFAAALFAVHPILVEAVVWISGGPYSMNAFFVLLCLVSYVCSKANKNWYVPLIISYIVLFGSSIHVIILPLLLILFEFTFGNLRTGWKRLLPVIGLSFFWGLYHVFKITSRLSSLQTTYYQDSGVLNPFIQIPTAVTHYLQLIVWPQTLAFYHSELWLGPIDFWLRVIALIAFFVLIVISYFKDKKIFFWLTFFFISLSPTLTPLKISSVVSERYVYLAATGIIVIFGIILSKLAAKKTTQPVAVTLFVIVMLALGARTVVRNMDWKSEDTLWLATGKTSPSSHFTHNNLGDYYSRQGDMEKAASEFRRAIELLPNYADAHHNLASVYKAQGKTDLAIEYYNKTLAINPNIWQTHVELAKIYFEQEKYDKAEEELKIAQKIFPQNSTLYSDLGVVYLKEGKKAEAEQMFMQALQMNPQDQKARIGLEELKK